jgi:hypothetical protein
LKYYERLEPWFRLANLLSREPRAREPEVRRFVKEYLLPRAQGANPDALFPSKLIYSVGERLAVQVRVILWFLVRGEPWHFRETREGSDTIAAAGIDRDGLVETGVFSPLQLFLGELKGTPVDRIRACEVCETLFFAVRKDRKCCSGECNHVRHVHRSQGNWSQYRENRKFRNKTGLPAVKGKELRALIERREALVEAKGSEAGSQLMSGTFTRDDA